MNGDTIVALSSGAGLSGVAVVRMSGPAAGEIVARMAGRAMEARRAVLRDIRDPVTGEKLDRGLVLAFEAPRSFTGEDSAEFQVHGSRAVVEGVLDAIRKIGGVRLAEPGEFSLRALRNGKLDLIAAEALSDLIAARTGAQRRQAIRNADTAEFDSWRLELIGILARVEAAIDFADEDSAVRETEAAAGPAIERLGARIAASVAASRQAINLRDGIRIAIVGPRNVGKSSLFNRLAGRDAAIVSDIAGTTRDVIEAEIVIAGVPVALMDTAGVAEGTADVIEREGMARTRRVSRRANLVLWIGAPDVPDGFDRESFDSQPLRVLNKMDLLLGDSRLIRNDMALPWHYRVSALTGTGMAELSEALEEHVQRLCGESDGPVLNRARQREAAVAALNALETTKDLGMEVLAENLRRAAHALGRLTGKIGVEDVLDSLFREFCIGK